MSATNPEEESTSPEPNLTPAESDSLGQLEAIAQHGLGTYVEVGNALTEIRDRRLYRDSHPSFESYVSERWGVSNLLSLEPRATLRHKPCEALAKACEQTLSALDGDERLGIEVRLSVPKQGDPSAAVAGSKGDELLAMLRWRLMQAAGTIGEIAHELESGAADIGDDEREQLRDDVLVLDGELAVVKALLSELVDWDSELGRLLKDELPPFDSDADPDDDE